MLMAKLFFELYPMFFYILSGVAIIVGLWLFISNTRLSKRGSGMISDTISYKNKQPIMPRHQRDKDIVAITTQQDKSDDDIHDVLIKPNSIASNNTAPNNTVMRIDEKIKNKINIDAQPATNQNNQSRHDNISLASERQPILQTPSPQNNTPPTNPNQIKQNTIKQSTANNDIAIQHRFENCAKVQVTDAMPMLDKYFHEQEEIEELRNNDALLNHQQNITIMVTPQNHFGDISGKQILEFAKTYALKYGIMSMFHRYENSDGTGMLWFSVLGVTHNNDVAPFDLNTIITENYRGIALFLSLPHPQAIKGFDSMVEIARDIAVAIDGNLHDEKGFLIDDKQIVALRTTAEQNQK